MNPINPRFLSSMYRKEPIPSVLATIGLVDAVIGGLDDRLGLLSFGIVTVSGAIALRWWLQQRHTEPSSPVTYNYLPPASSNSVPTLANHKRKHSK
jgi:hypothetical protein